MIALITVVLLHHLLIDRGWVVTEIGTMVGIWIVINGVITTIVTEDAHAVMIEAEVECATGAGGTERAGIGPGRDHQDRQAGRPGVGAGEIEMIDDTVAAAVAVAAVATVVRVVAAVAAVHMASGSMKAQLLPAKRRKLMTWLVRSTTMKHLVGEIALLVVNRARVGSEATAVVVADEKRRKRGVLFAAEVVVDPLALGEHS